MKSRELEKVSTIAVRKAENSGQAKADERKRAVERTSQSSTVLLDETSRWIASLPANVRPFACAHRFPRIANSIADLWRSVPKCEEYLDSLVIDLRGNRTGFPPDVARELRALRSYYADLHPHRDYAWELVDRDD
jgi:hypothetical protein